MRALTLRHPWPWTICYWGKPVENRSWAPSPIALPIGGRFAIHAGALSPPSRRGKVSGAAWEEVNEAIADLDGERLIPEVLTVTPRQLLAASSAVVATARLVGLCGPQGYVQARGAEDTKAVILARASKWFSGPWGWVLGDVVVLPTPVACPGKQGLWTLPPNVESMVHEQEQKAGFLGDRCLNVATTGPCLAFVPDRSKWCAVCAKARPALEKLERDSG